MSTIVILQQMLVIAVLALIGFGLEKKGTVDGLTSKKLSAIVVDICNPALILASILTGDLTAERSDLLIAMAAGACFYAFLILLGFILPKILKTSGEESRYYHLMTVYTNTGFIGIPVARAVLPDNAILYVIVINVFYSLLFYTHGLTVLSGGKEKPDLRKAINPGTVMALLSLAVFWFKLKFPPLIQDTITYIGNATIFLSMVLLGVSIARSRFTSALKDLRIWGYILLRMILVPAAVLILLKGLRLNSDLIPALVLMSAVPVGNLPMIQAERLGMDTKTLSSAIALTTVISLATITVFLSLTAAL